MVGRILFYRERTPARDLLVVMTSSGSLFAADDRRRCALRQMRERADRRTGLAQLVADLDVQRPKGALRLAQQQVERLLRLPDLVADALDILADRVAVFLHPLEPRQFGFDARLDVSQGCDVAGIAGCSGAR